MRARNIKPGFFENEELAQLPCEARLLYIGLWCIADRKGRFEWRPARIKVQIFPYDNIEVECHLMSLHDMSLILQYKHNGRLYGYIPNFEKHQNPHPHEAKSVLPDPLNEYSIITRYEFSTIPKHELNQCHDMSPKCNADILIPDTLKNIKTFCASCDAPQSGKTDVPFIETRKKRKLTGKRLETFSRFWNAFGYKKAKAEAADAWMDIPSLTNSLVDRIVEAAGKEAKQRPLLLARGQVPKMAQGWLSGRRWEDEAINDPVETNDYGPQYKEVTLD